MTNYDEVCKQCEAACGRPFKESEASFATTKQSLAVLDLGCGQGRDAIVAATYGHEVYAVDLAASGIAQLAERAKNESLAIVTEVADIESFDTDRAYDAVVFDRVLHMLPNNSRRLALLEKLDRWLKTGGHVLVADTKSNRELIRGFFEDKGWLSTLKKKDFLFAKRPPSEGCGRR